MFYLACTRFNDITYDENIKYRQKFNEIVIYGATLKIREIYSPGSLMFIVEMNNQKNRIEGIGLIKNSLICDKRHKIYDNDEYNRYIYRGNYWLSREQLLEKEPEIIETFDNILFKGKSHLKCRIGITVVTEKLFNRWDYNLTTIKNKVKKTFLHYFTKKDFKEEVLEVLEEESLKEDKLEGEIIIIPKKRKRMKNKSLQKINI